MVRIVQGTPYTLYPVLLIVNIFPHSLYQLFYFYLFLDAKRISLYFFMERHFILNIAMCACFSPKLPVIPTDLPSHPHILIFVFEVCEQSLFRKDIEVNISF